MHQENELVPYPERVHANFKVWLAQQSVSPPLPHAGEGRGEGETTVRPEPVEGQSRIKTPFTPEQIHWLEMIRDHIAANLGIDKEDFEYAPFAQEGGIGKVYQLFANELPKVLEELNKELAA